MIFKNGIKLCGSLIVAAIISVFLCFSINVICSALFTAEIGYNAYVYKDKEATEPMAQYEYFYADNDGDGKDDNTDTKMKEYEDEGYIVQTQKVRSTLTGTGKTVFLVVTQIFGMIMVIAFASNSSYKQGFKDLNLVKIGQVKKDILKGFKIGMIGNIPFFLLTILIIAMACGLAPRFYTVWYAFLSGHFYSLIMWIAGGSQMVGEMGAIQLVLLALIQFIVPAISGVAYILGYKEINLAEKLVYKKEVV
ncbi:MAG: hypothetical protein IJN56_05540 [Clostridia bacterium]|nr:hypothetical protein [Clostridia bacterium]